MLYFNQHNFQKDLTSFDQSDMSSNDIKYTFTIEVALSRIKNQSGLE